MPRATKRGRKNRGVPPPATFDIDTLPGSANLTVLEAAAIIRRTPGALEQWRRDPNHPLKWRYVDGRPLYRVDAVHLTYVGSSELDAVISAAGSAKAQASSPPQCSRLYLGPPACLRRSSFPPGPRHASQQAKTQREQQHPKNERLEMVAALHKLVERAAN
jgi:hypothetical protein